MFEGTENLRLDPEKVNGFAALCDARAVMQRSEQLLPLGWHQLFTHASDPWLATGADGHPQQRPQAVPAHLTKRMWAATEVHVAQPIRLTDSLVCLREAPVVSIKQGRSGELAFSREALRWCSGTQVLMAETKTVVYKAAQRVEQMQRHRSVQQPMPTPDVRQLLELDEVALFKYSALLGVAHRIHFDHPYATQVEGYPGLIVHGPLLIQLLLNLARANHLAAYCGRYTARALQPNHLGMALYLNLARSSEHVLLWVSDDEGHPTLIVTLHA